MIRQYELVERVKAYDPKADEEALNRAYVFSMVRHGSQTRESGDPYFSHPLEVAGILTELKLDSASIVTALLHDTVEDKVATREEIKKSFGADIARLVDGVTKLSKLELQSDTQRQAENFRKLLLAMSEDIRVLLVKLADRLHNMRTLHYVKRPERRKRIARETMDIFAPLAERIGMQGMKDELEDLAFRELWPEWHDTITKRLEFLRERGAGQVADILSELETTLDQDGIEAEVSGREKRPYSIWRKMEQKNVDFEQIADVVAFRVIVADIPTCYRALASIHTHYQAVHGRFKDYVSVPKRNGYRSLHTAVMGPRKVKIEVQIRTTEMHEVAEYGLAAHWAYKTSDGKPAVHEGKQYQWLRELLEIVEHAAEPEEFLEQTKLEMFSDQVFCFTPKGEVIALPRGATAVDFAYAVHSDVGDTCVGAKINGRHAPLRTPLASGDQVEILRSSGQTPQPSWESFVVTGRARARIRRFVRSQQEAEYLRLGRSIVEKTFATEERALHDGALAPALGKFKLRNADELFIAVGRGNVTGRQVFEAVIPGDQNGDGRRKVVPLTRARASQRAKRENPVPIRGLTAGMAVHLADCCTPLPGDRIVGLVTEGKGLTVHTIDCEILEQFSHTPELWVDVSWDIDGDAHEIHVGRIAAVINNEPGSLGALTTTIARSRCNISNLRITNRSPDFFEILVDVEVSDLAHLTSLIAALRADPAIYQVERARG
ncbi:MAG: bifunctional (p)ppGpp synthetase/guanosine-3',5'-bis(diphosphate) 3'-pyrophosphohydrolase [Rhodospirillaceae bacterium]|nr:bifunctional (p)ppGpp synthetase/guanosine-3',5'-bis(diphosphate) 3'-pyrophosphohydrolase [Rhodospirillaceae bacterium]